MILYGIHVHVNDIYLQHALVLLWQEMKRKRIGLPGWVYFCILVVSSLLLSGVVYLRYLRLSPPADESSHRLEGNLRSVQAISNPAKSKFAYVTLIHGIDDSYKYRGFLYNTIIMAQMLRQHGSTADVIAMIGFAANFTRYQFKDDLDLLVKEGVILYYLPRLLEERTPVGFAEMALLKLTPFSFTQYKKVQFFDGDIMPKKNMDCYFALDRNLFGTGAASPLNSGWYLAHPNIKHYEDLKKLAQNRFTKSWDKKMGWGTEIPPEITYKGGKKQVEKWEFNGANLDQGLFTHYFILNNGDSGLIDAKYVKLFDVQEGKQTPVESHVSFKEYLKCCDGKSPTSMFAHFTGSNKPWLRDSRLSSNKDLKQWGKMLDSLGLPYNSSNIHDQGFRPPLGFWSKT